MLDSGMCTYSANVFIGIRRFILATDYNTYVAISILVSFLLFIVSGLFIF